MSAVPGFRLRSIRATFPLNTCGVGGQRGRSAQIRSRRNSRFPSPGTISRPICRCRRRRRCIRAPCSHRSGRPRAAVSDGADPPGGVDRAHIDIPEPIRDIYRMWRPSPLIRARRLEQALGTPAKIYYKNEGVSPGRLAQAEHRRAAGLVQQGSGHQAALHRDRRRPMGLLARLCGLAVRHRRDRVPGARVLRSEALSPGADGNLRRALHRIAVERDRFRPGHPRQGRRTAPARSASPFPKRWKWRPRTRR